MLHSSISSLSPASHSFLPLSTLPPVGGGAPESLLLHSSQVARGARFSLGGSGNCAFLPNMGTLNKFLAAVPVSRSAHPIEGGGEEKLPPAALVIIPSPPTLKNPGSTQELAKPPAISQQTYYLLKFVHLVFFP